MSGCAPGVNVPNVPGAAVRPRLPSAQRRQQACPHQRRLSAARCAEHRQEARRFAASRSVVESTPLWPEEEPGVLFVECLKTSIRTDVIPRLDASENNQGRPLTALTRDWDAPGSSMPLRRLTHVCRLRNGGNAAVSKTSGRPGRRTRERRNDRSLPLRIGGESVFQVFPIADPAGSHQDRAGRVLPGAELPLYSAKSSSV